MSTYRGLRYLSWLEQQKLKEMLEGHQARMETALGGLSPELRAAIGGSYDVPMIGKQSLSDILAYRPALPIERAGPPVGHAEAAVGLPKMAKLSDLIYLPGPEATRGGAQYTLGGISGLKGGPGTTMPITVGQWQQLIPLAEAAQKREALEYPMQRSEQMAKHYALMSELSKKQHMERSAAKRKYWTYAISAIASLVSMGALGAVTGAIGAGTAGGLSGMATGAAAGLGAGTFGAGGLGSTLIGTGLGAIGGGISGGWKGALLGGLSGLAGAGLGRGLSGLLKGITPAAGAATDITNPFLRMAAEQGPQQALKSMGGYMGIPATAGGLSELLGKVWAYGRPLAQMGQKGYGMWKGSEEEKAMWDRVNEMIMREYGQRSTPAGHYGEFGWTD